MIGGHGALGRGRGRGGFEAFGLRLGEWCADRWVNEQAMAPGGTMTGSSTLPFQSGVAAPQPSYGASYGGSMDEDEPEPIR